MGFFTDASERFIIGPVVTMLQKQWGVGGLDKLLLSSGALLIARGLANHEAEEVRGGSARSASSSKRSCCTSGCPAVSSSSIARLST